MPDRVRMEELTVTARPLSAEEFAACGEVLAWDRATALGSNLYGPELVTYRSVPLDSDRPLEWLVVHGSMREARVRFLERHLQLAQAFIPLGGAPILVVCAPPDTPEVDGLPDLRALRAYVVPGDRGVQLHRGTWHEPPYLLAPGTSCLVTSHAALSQGLRAGLDAHGEIQRPDVDKRDVTARTGRLVRIALP